MREDIKKLIISKISEEISSIKNDKNNDAYIELLSYILKVMKKEDISLYELDIIKRYVMGNREMFTLKEEQIIISEINNLQELDDIVILEKNLQEITVKEIDSLFKKYKYSINFINILKDKNEYKKLKMYGNIEKIKSILDIFKEYQISEEAFEYNENKFLLLLIFSNVNIIEKICNYIMNEKEQRKTFNERFKEYLRFISIFGNKKCVYRNENNVTKKNTERSYYQRKPDFYGIHNIYTMNRDYLENLGLDVKKDFIMLEKNPIVIRNNYQILVNYGFSIENINKSPNILALPDLDKKIDYAIELDILDKIKANPSNLSRFNLSEKSPALYRIKYCKLNGISIDGTGDGKNIRGKITNNRSSFEKINPTAYILYQELTKNLVNDNTKIFIPSVKERSKLDFTLEDEYNYRMNYFESLLNAFDEKYMDTKYRYIFSNNEKNVIISRYKVKRNISKYLRIMLEDNLDIENNDNINQILMYCICKDSLLTSEEIKIIENNVYDFIDTKNAQFSEPLDIKRGK